MNVSDNLYTAGVSQNMLAVLQSIYCDGTLKENNFKEVLNSTGTSERRSSLMQLIL